MVYYCHIRLYLLVLKLQSAILLVFVNLQSIEFHERGKKHKENVQKRIQEVGDIVACMYCTLNFTLEILFLVTYKNRVAIFCVPQ